MKTFFLGLGLFCLSSCLPEQVLTKGERIAQSRGSHNAASSVPLYHSRILKKSPILIAPKAHPADELFRYLNPHPSYIVDKNVLQYDCKFDDGIFLEHCMGVQKNEVLPITVSSNQKWAYSPESQEFLEVNTFYHASQSISEFFRLQKSSIDLSMANFDDHSSIPESLRQGTSLAPLWLGDKKLTLYSDCQKKGRPFFLFASSEVCLGDHESVASLNFSEDPDIIHHEMAHFFSTVLYNQRNAADTSLPSNRRLSFGGLGYSEMDLIAEGFSDWFAHHHSKRTRVFEWAGHLTKNVRPVTEADSLHRLNQIGLSTKKNERLRYPDFINYYHYDPFDFLTEDVQQAGMIVSHFLTTLGREMKEVCQVSSEKSNELLFYLVQETLSEMGDLTTRSRNSSTVSRVNMIPDVSHIWAHLHTPPNVRLFAQKMGKHFLRTINGQEACGGIVFGQDRLEEIIDSYGLLLFRTYNESGNCEDSTHCAISQNTLVTPTHRKISTLLSKNSLVLSDDNGKIPEGVYLLTIKSKSETGSSPSGPLVWFSPKTWAMWNESTWKTTITTTK